MAVGITSQQGMRVARCGSEEESSLITGMVQGCDGSAAQRAAAHEGINY